MFLFTKTFPFTHNFSVSFNKHYEWPEAYLRETGTRVELKTLF